MSRDAVTRAVQSKRKLRQGSARAISRAAPSRISSFDARWRAEFAGLIAGEKRVSRRVGLVTENYFVPSSVGTSIVSGGVRFMSEKLTVDVALFNSLTHPIFPGFPWVSFIYKF